MNRTSELALPAGSLQCALYAFKGGADAVYFGLRSFSARKGAVNFSFDDVRKLKALCSEGGQYEGKKFYVTLNTIASDTQLNEVIRLLRQLDYLRPDGLIVQDLGIAKIIRERFPNLPLHGSTQLAVHTINGVKELQRLGFSRVVLSRELSFDEIKTIREAFDTTGWPAETSWEEKLRIANEKYADDGKDAKKKELWVATNGELTISAGILYAPVTLPLSEAIDYAESLLASAKSKGRDLKEEDFTADQKKRIEDVENCLSDNLYIIITFII